MIGPTLEELLKLKHTLAPRVRQTPILSLGKDLHLKLECLQLSGSFKVRGALAQALQLSQEARRKGLIAVSGGNHGIAIAVAAGLLGVSAKVYLDKAAPSFRVKRCQEFGADVIIEQTRQSAFEACMKDASQSGAAFIHPFDHISTIAGTGTLALELHDQLDELDAVVVAIGGGGLAAGVSHALSLISPKCEVLGVQSSKADAMVRSIRSGVPERNPEFSHAAFSLCPPQVGTLTLEYCKKYIREIVTVDDEAVQAAMAELFSHTGLMIEGAGAAPFAAIRGPLAKRLQGKKVALLICGSNISPTEFQLLAKQEA